RCHVVYPGQVHHGDNLLARPNGYSNRITLVIPIAPRVVEMPAKVFGPCAVAQTPRVFKDRLHSRGTMRQIVARLGADSQSLQHSLTLGLTTKCQIGPTGCRAKHVDAEAYGAQWNMRKIRLGAVGLDDLHVSETRHGKNGGPVHLLTQAPQNG